MIKKILLLFILIILASCNASKPIIVTKKTTTHSSKKVAVKTPKKSSSSSKFSKKEQNNSAVETIESTSKTVVTSDLVNDYIFQFKGVAMSNMKNYGIPASIILAQGILESGAGRGRLAVNANNHFGIKCHKEWTGDSVKQDDDAEQECFRKYNDPSESFKDHAVFLSGRSRYAVLFELPKDDYKAWAKGLRAAGYATDPRYPEKLISYIERYNLHQYDNQVLGKEYVINENQTIRPAAKKEVVDVDSYEVKKGDTLYSISKKFNVLVEDLKQKNNLADFSISIGQKLIVK
ncbi:MAG: glucosaminidase domain-containing protein [Flavobacterium sp.]|jgi:flagellum-specific peptidoglycan hydrolase FlgJ|nr:glucosaminidase domain-containing protein [uncultured Flavobacterium sp.]MDD2820331.1 glucosaminidase domain-containing protein [Flavobacterium sp.]